MKSEVSEVNTQEVKRIYGKLERQVKLKAVQVKEKMNTFRNTQRKHQTPTAPNTYSTKHLQHQTPNTKHQKCFLVACYIIITSISGNMVFHFIQISEILPSISVQESWFTLISSCQIRYSSSMTSSLVLPRLYVSMKPRYDGVFLYLEWNLNAQYDESPDLYTKRRPSGHWSTACFIPQIISCCMIGIMAHEVGSTPKSSSCHGISVSSTMEKDLFLLFMNDDSK
ncbi:hypothetical protein K501DRAFT_316042 [Backusella circina FSU 941]|nr:hypothetical protein K501DRAFT_316042 [Backusella circina FSU 941]